VRACLDSYEAERVPVAQRLLETTDRAFRIVVSDSWLAELARTHLVARIAAFVLRFAAARRFAFRTVSQIASLPGQFAVAHPRRHTGGCAARRRPLSVAAPQVRGW